MVPPGLNLKVTLVPEFMASSFDERLVCESSNSMSLGLAAHIRECGVHGIHSIFFPEISTGKYRKL